jgi:hypothetical protein
MKTRRKQKRKLDPIKRAIVAAASMPAPKGPAKPKVTPKFRSFCLAWLASQNLPGFREHIYNAALTDDKRFFKYLADFLTGKAKRVPMNEEQIKLLQVSGLNSSEALKKLPWLTSKGHYRSEKKKALDRSKLMGEAYHEAWREGTLAREQLESYGRALRKQHRIL